MGIIGAIVVLGFLLSMYMIGVRIDENQKRYTVERTETKYGRGGYRFYVLVPSSENKDKVMANFEMASKYAQDAFIDWEYFEDGDKAEYDEHLEEMGAIRNVPECDSDDVFAYYLTAICGYTIEEVEEPDFKYEW